MKIHQLFQDNKVNEIINVVYIVTIVENIY